MATKSLPAKTADAAAERAGSAGQKIGWAIGWLFIANVVVHAFTTYREWTICLGLRALARATTAPGQDPGFWANLFTDSAANYDTVWSWLLGWGA